MPPLKDKPSSGDEGFFQQPPVVVNQFEDDVSLQRIIQLFFPRNVRDAVAPTLHHFGQEVLTKQIFDWVTDAERNLPYLKGAGRDAFGRRTNELVVTEGWRELQNFGIRNGIITSGYDGKYGQYSRVFQFLKAHLWTPSCANVGCPSAMTDGAAKLLGRHLRLGHLESDSRAVFQNVYDRLIASDTDLAWTSGQWMTERSGGSNVSNTETIAKYCGSTEAHIGPWTINGFKWFSSATDSSMAVLLAQSPQGLSAFLAPMRVSQSLDIPSVKTNGIYIQRLKNKFGTKSLPTAELELKDTRAHLIGTEGRGIHEISTILNISRLWSSVSAVGYLGRGIAIVKAWAKVRRVAKDQLLKHNALHMSTLATIARDYHASMLFVFFVAYLTGMEEHTATLKVTETHQPRIRPESQRHTQALLRVMTSILKAVVCKRSIHGLQECMEALGGVGYLDNSENESINIARLYRDCCVLSIWEGTTDVLASDTIKVLKGRLSEETIAALDAWIVVAIRDTSAVSYRMADAREAVLSTWRTLREHIEASSTEILMPRARDIIFELGDLIMAVLLIVDVETNFDVGIEHALSKFIARISRHDDNGSHGIEVERDLDLNRKLVYGLSTEAQRQRDSKL